MIFKGMIIFRGKLFGGTVQPNNTLFGGTIPPNHTLSGGTVPPIAHYLATRHILYHILFTRYWLDNAEAPRLPTILKLKTILAKLC